MSEKHALKLCRKQIKLAARLLIERSNHGFSGITITS
jgi:hypothetical protein